MSTGRGWGTAPKKDELPYFVVGVTGTADFDDQAAVNRTLARLTARVSTTHRVVIHTGCGHPADRHARDFADARGWPGGVTQCSPAGLRPREVTLRALCGLLASCDAVVLFAPAGCHEARFAETVSREVRTPVRIAGRKTSTDIPAARPA